jgi:methylmalonyl-CoA/ethylmalonyl-CoA epimerase
MGRMAMDAAAEDLQLRFHHVALVARQLEPVAEFYCRVLGYRAAAPPIVDAAQKVRVQFLQLGDFTLELLEPSEPDSPVAEFARAGNSLYHVCYECDNLDATIEHLRKSGSAIARPPTPAPAIGHRRVVFLVTRQRQLIELVEAKLQGAPA